MKKIFRSILFLGFALLPSCLVGPEYQAPEIKTPANWANRNTAGLSQESKDLSTWWEQFGDPVLNELVQKAYEKNLDLQIAEWRVWEARSLYGIVSSQDRMRADVVGSGIRSRKSGNTVFVPPGRISSQWEIGFDAIWEFDLFGGIHRSKQAAYADFESSVESLRDVLVSLMGEVARNYSEFRSLQYRLGIAKANSGAQEETLRLIQARVDAGMANDFDLARSEALVSKTKSQIPSLEEQMKHSAYRLAVLLGEAPETLWEILSTTQGLMKSPKNIPVGIPADLLRRRPDLRRAERELAAASARVGVATADLYPKFSIIGSLGLQNQKFLELTHSGGTYWSLGPSMRWPLLDAGRNRAALQAEDARKEQALLRYQQAVLLSLEEVESSMLSYQKEQERAGMLKQSLESSRRAVKLARELYEKGLVDFLSVLEAERNVFDAEDIAVQSESAVQQNLIHLFKGLGGGWSELPQEEESAQK